MSKISCDIIQDMLPLYYDEVCSADSRKMKRSTIWKKWVSGI